MHTRIDRIGIDLSILLFVVGAILTLAVEARVPGIDLNTLGIIFMVIGVVGVLLFVNIGGAHRPLGDVAESDRTGRPHPPRDRRRT
jgi:hypothetical protein